MIQKEKKELFSDITKFSTEILFYRGEKMDFHNHELKGRKNILETNNFGIEFAK
tara:strand:+ start:456 stop:617 length:162 start_codon:yes stop_codon:yes gene_type:complete